MPTYYEGELPDNKKAKAAAKAKKVYGVPAKASLIKRKKGNVDSETAEEEDDSDDE